MNTIHDYIAGKYSNNFKKDDLDYVMKELTTFWGYPKYLVRETDSEVLGKLKTDLDAVKEILAGLKKLDKDPLEALKVRLGDSSGIQKQCFLLLLNQINIIKIVYNVMYYYSSIQYFPNLEPLLI